MARDNERQNRAIASPTNSAASLVAMPGHFALVSTTAAEQLWEARPLSASFRLALRCFWVLPLTMR
jgi:hypothetical protein